MSKVPLPPAGSNDCVRSTIEYFLKYEASNKMPEECSYSGGLSGPVLSKIRNIFLTSFSQRMKGCAVADSAEFELGDSVPGTVSSRGSIEKAIRETGTAVSRIVQLLGIRLGKGRSAHANALIWDLSLKRVYLFEPNGHDVGWDQEVVTTLQQFVDSSDVLREFRVVPPLDYCPAVFAQGIAQTQNCANWSLLLLVLSINCPSNSISDIIDLVEGMGKGTDGKTKLRDMMQRFASWLHDYWVASGLDELWKCSDLIKVVQMFYQQLSADMPAIDADPPVASTYPELLAMQRKALHKFYDEHRSAYEFCRLSIIRSTVAESFGQILSNARDVEKDGSIIKRYTRPMMSFISGWNPESLLRKRTKLCNIRQKWLSKQR